jgi:hypothetical protein
VATNVLNDSDFILKEVAVPSEASVTVKFFSPTNAN